MSEESRSLERPSLLERDADLVADCERCCGLCCVAPGFSQSAEFAIHKPPGEPCSNLSAEFRCAIHDQLRDRGFSGCVVYDCFGAGQKVTQVTFKGKDWTQTPEIRAPMFEVFAVMRSLHEMLIFLEQALLFEAVPPALGHLIKSKRDEIAELSLGGPEALRELETTEVRRAVEDLLLRVGRIVRGESDGSLQSD